MLAAAVQWLRRSRYLFLVLCSPILLPFLCLAELCRRRSGRSKAAREDERPRMAEEGRCAEEVEGEDEIGLLQRYLEDQLMLAGSVYECGDDCDESGGGFLSSRHQRTPLLA